MPSAGRSQLEPISSSGAAVGSCVEVAFGVAVFFGVGLVAGILVLVSLVALAGMAVCVGVDGGNSCVMLKEPIQLTMPYIIPRPTIPNITRKLGMRGTDDFSFFFRRSAGFFGLALASCFC